MELTRKIYLNDKLIILTSDKEKSIIENTTYKNYVVFHGSSAQIAEKAVERLGKHGTEGVIIEDASPETLFSHFQSIYHPLDAAGGVVFNEAGEILMIYRRGKWDLPKGKLDAGESIEHCALREVSEETGLQSLTLAGKICDTYHIYEQNHEQLLKRTAWYKMTGTSADKLQPQQEENIIEARWIAEKDLAPFVAKTYEAVKEVLRGVGLHW